MNSVARSLITGIPILILAGCGGGGAGGGASQTAAVTPADITSLNAPVIAGAVMQSALEGGGLGAFAGVGSGSIVQGPNSQLFATLGEIQKTHTESLRQKAQYGVLQDTIPPQMTDCLNGGTVTVSGEVTNPLTLSPTDSFTLIYTACDDGAGIMNGTYEMSVTGFNGDLLSGMFVFDVTVTLTAFEITDAGETVTANGSISISLDLTASSTMSVSVTSTGLTVAEGSSSHTLGSFSVTQTVDQLTSAYTMTVSGALTSSAFTGRVTFSTSIALQSDGLGYAFTGEVTITGADSASITVIVIDDVLVRLEIDLDGVNGPDEIVDTTWAELLAQT